MNVASTKYILSAATTFQSPINVMKHRLLPINSIKYLSAKPPVPNDNLTAVLYGKNDLRLEQRPIPKPKNDEVLLRMEVVGIGGNDVRFLVAGAIDSFDLKQPIVLGHEATGTVVEVGKDVTNLKRDDRVSLEPGVPCRRCSFCKEGRYNLCPTIRICARPPTDGNLTRYFAHAADFCYKLPQHISVEEGVLIEILAIGVHGCRRARVGLGSTVLILGAGSRGLAAMMAAKSFGASAVMIADIVQYKLEVAKQMGADHTILLDKNQPVEETTQLVVLAMGSQPTVCMVCAISEQAMNVALQATRSGGAVLYITVGSRNVSLPLTRALVREVNVMGVLRYSNEFKVALDMVASRKINVKKLITHHYRLEEVQAAFETAKGSVGNPIKVLIHTNTDWNH